MDDSQLQRARDRAFSEYGAIEYITVNDAQCTVSVNAHIKDNNGYPIGLIGDFSLPGPNPTVDPLFELASQWLTKQGCKTVQGPIVRHTWYPFRLVTSGFDAMEPFSGEPWNTPALRHQLQTAGFTEIAWYNSTYSTDSTSQIAAGDLALRNLISMGYQIRPLDPERLFDDLEAIYHVTLNAFQAPWNYLFHPISFDEFQLVLGPTVTALRPDLIQLCIAPDGEPAAYVYATEEINNTACIKTLAVAQEHQGRKVGTAMTAALHRVFETGGFTRVVHGLVRVGGPSEAITEKGNAKVFRQYSVLERQL